jgi:phosphatidylserine decarboxylase
MRGAAMEVRCPGAPAVSCCTMGHASPHQACAHTRPVPWCVCQAWHHRAGQRGCRGAPSPGVPRLDSQRRGERALAREPDWEPMREGRIKGGKWPAGQPSPGGLRRAAVTLVAEPCACASPVQLGLSRFELAGPPTPRDTEASNAYAVIHDLLGPVCICSLIGINSNAWGVQQVPKLLCVNERVVTLLQTPQGPVAVVMIAAMHVGQINLAYRASPPRGAARGAPSRRRCTPRRSPSPKARSWGSFTWGVP